MTRLWAGVLIGVPLLTVGVTVLETASAREFDQESSQRRAFVAAAKRGDENAVRRSIEADPDLVMATDELGMTALDWAATREHWHIFRQLLDDGAPVDRVGADGGTVLHRVAHHDRPDIVQLVVDAGAVVHGRSVVLVSFKTCQTISWRSSCEAGRR